ncbi:MAG: LamG domain-containing protein [Planctomycetota bacterium]
MKWTDSYTLVLALAVGLFGIAAPAMAERQDIFADDFETYTSLYSYLDLSSGGYTVVNGSGYADAAWRLWNTAGDMLGTEGPDLAGMTDNYAITDSDLAPQAHADEQLITPEMDCANYINVRLDFSKNFRVYADDPHDQIAEVDIRSSDDGITWSGWINLLRYDRITTSHVDSNPEQLDISQYADGKRVQIRFHFYDAVYDYWFAVDDLVVSGEPVVNAGPDHVFGTPVPIPMPYPVPLVGTVTDDGLPAPPGQMTVEWSVVSGPGDVGVGDGNMDMKDPDSSYPVVATFYQYGTYVLRLTASDGEFEAYDDVQVSLIGENGLVAYYPVYEGEGELLHDVSGNVHHGAKIGDPCHFATPINIPSPALEFDGDDYVSIEGLTVETVATGQITVSAWVSFEGVPEGASVTIPLIEKGEVYKLTAGLHDSDEPLRFGFAVLGGEASSDHQPEFEARRWYHVAGTYDGQRICSYIDGTLWASKDHVTALPHTDPTTIGGPVPAEDTQLFGSKPYRIDEVRMYSRALTPAEVYERYYTASQVLRYEESLIPGDTSRDGRVDLRDLAIMADNWLVSESL